MVGIFDSGSGGLSVLKELRKVQPQMDIVYLGDIANAPYGNRNREELGALTVMMVRRLLSEGATKIISACNSVSGSIVLPMLSILELSPFDMVEMVGPTVKELKAEKGPILLAATKATIDSGIYQIGFESGGKKINTVAMPELAGMIEFGADREKIEKTIKYHFKGVKMKNGVLVLGCTHYPLVRESFEKVIRELELRFRLYDPAMAVAKTVAKWKDEGRGMTKFLITKESDIFRDRVRELVGSNYKICVI